ncbi:Protein kinase protein with adenine nucleotide alpha hydrolase-like domain [Forsythia ovata]|uniref:RING-type E3 ubiquitin transferase n=1 Tax=Forsythia ovata TaxID=205694 RepID=A0ABD1TUG0_9LAMI
MDTISNAVAIDKDKNSHYAVKWAVENLDLKDNLIILVHVTTQQNLHLQDVVPKEGRAPTQTEIQQFFLPYRGFCARKGIRAKEVILYSVDVASALVQYITDNFITNIVLGACSRGAISRAFRNVDVPSSLGNSAPDTCSVYAISKGRVLKIKSVSQPFMSNSARQSSDTGYSPHTPACESFHWQGSWRNAASEISSLDGGSHIRSLDSHQDMHLESKNALTLNSVNTNREYLQMTPKERHFGIRIPSPQSSMDNNSEFLTPRERFYSTKSPLPQQSANTSFASVQSSVTCSSEFMHMTPPNGQSGNKISSPQKPVDNLNLRVQTKEGLSYSASESSSHSDLQSFQSSNISFELLDQPHTLDGSRSSTSSQAAGELEDELRRLKLDLKQIKEKYNGACKEAVTAREKVREIDQWKSDEASKLEEAKDAQKTALDMVAREKQKCKAAVEIAQKAQRIAELESEKRKRAEIRFKHEAEEKNKAIDALARNEIRCRKYSIEEIEVATKYFSDSEKIGEGGYGPVYKATLDHTAVAIKVLRSEISQGQKQFHQEVEVLSRLRHPNMVILLGACPEYGCLVYEHMENGSLEDRLYCRNGTPSIPWATRFRIAAEIATALLFLHQARPEPFVHRDLKPANILLDKNYVSKISDVGLCRLVPPSVDGIDTEYRMTAAAGTFCYIDPEYQQTGMLGTKSDIYSFGVMLLQIITARPAMGLTYHVERAIEKGQFAEILDQTVKDWPVEEASIFAKLALKCCELRKKDRPDLDSVILPELIRLREVGSGNKGKYGFDQKNARDQSFQKSLSNTRSRNSENQCKYASGSGSSSVTTVEIQD